MDNQTIMVVDDNPTNMKLACDVLEWAGYQVVPARDAEEALVMIGQAPPALILMDVGLPGMDGLALTRLLKASEATRHIRIMALTAYAMKGDEERILAAGCDGYISKPIEVRELAGQVARCLEQNPKV